MGQSNKVGTYKNMLLVSTFCGIFGVYFFYKGFNKTLAWLLIGIWALVGIVVRFLIIMGKKSSKNKKEV
jgi:uncharacterized membrane protein